MQFNRYFATVACATGLTLMGGLANAESGNLDAAIRHLNFARELETSGAGVIAQLIADPPRPSPVRSKISPTFGATFSQAARRDAPSPEMP